MSQKILQRAGTGALIGLGIGALTGNAGRGAGIGALAGAASGLFGGKKVLKGWKKSKSKKSKRMKKKRSPRKKSLRSRY